MNGHLTEIEKADLIAGSPNSAETHLTHCRTCREEVEQMRLALTNFNLALTGFAAAQPLPMPALKQADPRKFKKTAQAGWSAPVLALAGLAVFAVALTSGHHRVSASGPEASVQAQQASAQATEVSDEALLNGINQDLSTPIPPSLAPLAPVNEDGAGAAQIQRK